MRAPVAQPYGSLNSARRNPGRPCRSIQHLQRAVRSCAAAGAAIGVNYRSDADGAALVVGEIEAAGGRALALQADVANPEEATALVARCPLLRRPMRPLRRQGPRCKSARWAERRDASTHMLRCSGTAGPSAAAAARCSSCTTAIAAVIAATCSGGGALRRYTGRPATAASCRACAPATARASCAASRTR